MPESDSAPKKTQKMIKIKTMANFFRKIIFRFSITKGKWPLPVQENLDHMGKNGCQKRILHPKKHRKQSFLSMRYVKKKFSVDQCYGLWKIVILPYGCSCILDTCYTVPFFPGLHGFQQYTARLNTLAKRDLPGGVEKVYYAKKQGRNSASDEK